MDADPGDGACATSHGTCTLRAAVMEANALAGSQTIVLPGGTYPLTRSGTGERRGDIDITSSLTIKGAGSRRTTVTAGGNKGIGDRVFDIDDPTAAVSVAISDLSVTGGRAAGTAPDSTDGGGIRLQDENYGIDVTLDHVRVAGNRAKASGTGGGIFASAYSVLSVTDSTFEANRADRGGAVFGSAGVVHVLRSAIVRNIAFQAGGIESYGQLDLFDSTVAANPLKPGGNSGGVLAATGSLVDVENATIAGNDGAQVNVQSGGSALFLSTIVKGPCDVTGSVSPNGHNLETGKTCGFEIQKTNPRLRALGDYGGPTQTMGLRPSSPAIGVGHSGPLADCSGVDQRGAPRKESCDIGAYELVRCRGSVVNVVGTAGRDVVRGGPAAESFLMLGGNDVVHAGGGGDRVCGGAGRDQLYGQGGNDRLDGGGGIDLCDGGPGSDRAWRCETRRSLP